MADLKFVILKWVFNNPYNKIILMKYDLKCDNKNTNNLKNRQSACHISKKLLLSRALHNFLKDGWRIYNRDTLREIVAKPRSPIGKRVPASYYLRSSTLSLSLYRVFLEYTSAIDVNFSHKFGGESPLMHLKTIAAFLISS